MSGARGGARPRGTGVRGAGRVGADRCGPSRGQAAVQVTSVGTVAGPVPWRPAVVAAPALSVPL
ncbi:hypothetical protein GCM10027168_71510 [Streptomyces capparidis]